MFTVLLAPAHRILNQTYSAPFVSLVFVYKDFWEEQKIAIAEIKLTKRVEFIAR